MTQKKRSKREYRLDRLRSRVDVLWCKWCVKHHVYINWDAWVSLEHKSETQRVIDEFFAYYNKRRN